MVASIGSGRYIMDIYMYTQWNLFIMGTMGTMGCTGGGALMSVILLCTKAISDTQGRVLISL